MRRVIPENPRRGFIKGGGFRVGDSQVEGLQRYIAGQKERHGKQTFEQELVAILKKYRLPYDERYMRS